MFNFHVNVNILLNQMGVKSRLGSAVKAQARRGLGKTSMPGAGETVHFSNIIRREI
jgi:hypothetical protein